MAVSTISNAPYCLREWKTIPLTWYSTTNPYASFTSDISKSGYKARRIVGWGFVGTLASYCFLANAWVNESTQNAHGEARMAENKPSTTTQNSVSLLIEYEKD